MPGTTIANIETIEDLTELQRNYEQAEHDWEIALCQSLRGQLLINR